MVIKGSARAGAGELAAHLLRVDTNESVNVLQFAGVASLDLREALAELDGMGAGSRSQRTLYHASINTPVVEQLSRDQQDRARERLAFELGLYAQPFVVVEHVKHGRQHTHIVWSRIDTETARAIPDSHNYRKHEIVSRELEREFGHAHVLGAHVRDKEKEPRPERGPTWGDQRQAERSGITPANAKAIVTEIWQRTATGDEFRQRLEEAGFTLARGHRRDFVLIDPAGEVHGLTRRIEGVKAAQVRERMGGIDAEAIPDIATVQRQAKETERHTEKQTRFISAVERLRADEQRSEQSRAGQLQLTGSAREVADAIWQLNKTMRSQIESTIPSRPDAPPTSSAKSNPPAKGSLYDQAVQAHAARTATDILRRQESRKRPEHHRDHDR